MSLSTPRLSGSACNASTAGTKLLFVVGRLRHVSKDDELRLNVNGGLGVVALHESIGGWHDARFFVGEIDLRRRLNAQFGKLGTRTLGLLAVAFLLFALRQSFCMLGLD